MSLAAVSTYLPDRVLLTDLPELADLDDAERALCLALGIERVTVDDELSTVDLAVRAARRTLAVAGVDPQALDGVLLVEARAPGTLASSEATGLQAALGANAAWAFSIGGLGCASIVPALLTARGLLAADPEISHILVAHGSRPVASRRYRHPVTVNGDSGQAVVVSREGPLRVRDILLETNGAYWDLFQVDYRGNPPQDWREVCADLPRYAFSLAVESRKRIAALNRRLLERNGVDQDDISCYVGQNLSTAALQVVGESLGVKIADGCRDNLRENGHLGPNDALLNLSTAIDSGDLPEGGRAVVLNMSPAAAWSAMLVEHRAPDNRTVCL